MGIFDSFSKITKWFKKADDFEKMAKDGLAQAKGVTKMIPGDADDKLVENLSKKVDDISSQYNSVKQNIPGAGSNKE